MADTGVTVEFGDVIDPVVNARVREFCRILAERQVPGIIEVIPTYRSALVHFDPVVLTRESVHTLIRSALCVPAESQTQTRKITRLPVLYGGDEGPDLAFVARHANLEVDEVIRLHTQPLYLVYMLGFTPGYPYMGGLDPRLATPRLSTPRLKTPRGSVGIAGGQTGIYSVDSPGGWRIIGRTPVKLFDPESTPQFLFEAGDYIQFRSVLHEEYLQIAANVQDGSYRPEVCYEPKDD